MNNTNHYAIYNYTYCKLLLNIVYLFFKYLKIAYKDAPGLLANEKLL